jgi:NitT/TauT family transport system permease protein
VTTRLVSLLVLLASWQIAAHFGNPRLLPCPVVVFATIKAEVASGTLFAALSITIARVAAAFILAISRVGDRLKHAFFGTLQGPQRRNLV